MYVFECVLTLRAEFAGLVEGLLAQKGAGWKWPSEYDASADAYVDKHIASEQLRFVGQSEALGALAQQVTRNRAALRPEQVNDNKLVLPVVIGGPPGTGKYAHCCL